MTRVDLHDDLDGQTALVTGATRGIGRRIATELADLGATVYAGAREVADVDATDRQPIRLDVTDDDEVAAAAERVRDETGRLDVLVNNAGVFERAGPLHETSMETVDRTLGVNLRGPVLVTRHALPLLRETDRPRVVTLSSGLGRYTDGQMGGGYPPYRVSKAAVGGLTAYLDAEYGDEGLLASAASPGWVRTAMGGSEATRSVAEGADTPVWLARMRDGPGGRLWKDRETVSW
ncbi:MAG: dehydrogenase [uncultured archaeon A07HB70]|nr:MAG: dehydrogenase [uncultured archaeon A07HB70]